MTRVLFGRDDVQPAQPVPVQRAAAPTETATYNIRGWGAFLFIGGMLMGMTGVLLIPGLVLVIVGLTMVAFGGTNSQRTQQMVEASADGDGCGTALAAVVGAVVVVAIAALAVATMLIGGGL